MGFRSVLITEDTYVEKLPDWFVEKYQEYLNMDRFPFSSKYERKYYDNFAETEIFIDLQKALIESEFLKDADDRLVIILLHECDGITRVNIYKDKIQGMEPTAWKKVDSVEHNYCYGCSEVD